MRSPRAPNSRIRHHRRDAVATPAPAVAGVINAFPRQEQRRIKGGLRRIWRISDTERPSDEATDQLPFVCGVTLSSFLCPTPPPAFLRISFDIRCRSSVTGQASGSGAGNFDWGVNGIAAIRDAVSDDRAWSVCRSWRKKRFAPFTVTRSDGATGWTSGAAPATDCLSPRLY